MVNPGLRGKRIVHCIPPGVEKATDHYPMQDTADRLAIEILRREAI